MPRTSLCCLFIAPIHITGLWHIAFKTGVMTGPRIELQLFWCDLSTSCVSPESSEHPISSVGGHPPAIFQERRSGSQKICLLPLFPKLSIFCGGVGLPVTKDFFLWACWFELVLLLGSSVGTSQDSHPRTGCLSHSHIPHLGC